MLERLKESARFETSSSKKQKVTHYVTIDYPQENEIIKTSSYTLRIGTIENGTIKISIDGSDWQPCYYSYGYWWFNWENYSQVTHTIVAKFKSADGKILRLSRLRKCMCKF